MPFFHSGREIELSEIDSSSELGILLSQSFLESPSREAGDSEASVLDGPVDDPSGSEHISSRLDDELYDRVEIRNICGTDERIAVTNTRIYPYSATCFIYMVFWDGTKERGFIGTGFLWSGRVLYTAGHCLHDVRYGWARRVSIWPGRNGNLIPFGGTTSSSFYVPPEWKSAHSTDFDYGAVLIDSPGFTNPAIWGFGLESRPTKYLLNEVVRTVGYPGDKPMGTAWETGGKIQSVGPRKFAYMFDSFGGQSGSPVFTRETYGSGGRTHFALGIHTNGGCPNRSTRVIPELINRLPK